MVVLIDSRSTHSFIDPSIAKKAHLGVTRGNNLSVMVVNGDRLPCLGCCEVIPFHLQGNYFYANLYLLPLVGCDLVLGVDWLSYLGPILWDFTRLTMKFTWCGKRMQLQGLSLSDLTIEDAENFCIRGNPEGLVLQLMEVSREDNPNTIPEELQPLLEEKFHSIFQEPKGILHIKVKTIRYPLWMAPNQ